MNYPLCDYPEGNWWEETTGGLSLPDFPDGLDSDAWDPTGSLVQPVGTNVG